MAKTILYAEDEVELAEEVIEELKELDFSVTHCIDYVSSRERASEQRYDLILVDIHLKMGTGDMLIKDIKQNPEHINHNTPVIVASSQVTKDLIGSIGSDIDYALIKPYSLNDLIANITKVFAKVDRKNIIVK